jgi:hypothetical protein
MRGATVKAEGNLYHHLSILAVCLPQIECRHLPAF